MNGMTDSLYKLVVVSDTHRSVSNLRRIMPIINSANYFIFCGDGLSDVMQVRGEITVPIICVRGNCDIGTDIVDTATTTLGNTRALVTHGHRFNVKQGLGALYSAAVKNNCGIVFFGHTHSFTDQTYEGVHLINPGSLFNGSYALVAGDGTDFICKRCFVS